jgi:enoyl-CoA hydratase/carnithine racemase
MEIALKGQLFGAAEAKELGLINEIVPRQSLEDTKKNICQI